MESIELPASAPARCTVVPSSACFTSPAPKRFGDYAEGGKLPHRAQAAATWPPLEALVFDMGDVLYDATLWRRWLLKLLGQMGLRTQYRTFFAVWDREYLNDVHRGRREYREAFEAFLLAAGLTRAQIEEVEAASQPRKRELENCLRPLPGVVRTLDGLVRRGMKLAVLSDTERGSASLADWLDRLGLGGRFQATVSSFDLDSVKPAASNYGAACAALGVALEQAAFVGHDQEELDGAVAAGMRSIAFNADPDVVADVVLERFAQLAEVAARWASRPEAVAAGSG